MYQFICSFRCFVVPHNCLKSYPVDRKERPANKQKRTRCVVLQYSMYKTFKIFSLTLIIDHKRSYKIQVDMYVLSYDTV